MSNIKSHADRERLVANFVFEYYSIYLKHPENLLEMYTPGVAFERLASDPDFFPKLPESGNRADIERFLGDLPRGNQQIEILDVQVSPSEGHGDRIVFKVQGLSSWVHDGSVDHYFDQEFALEHVAKGNIFGIASDKLTIFTPDEKKENAEAQERQRALEAARPNKTINWADDETPPAEPLPEPADGADVATEAPLPPAQKVEDDHAPANGVDHDNGDQGIPDQHPEPQENNGESSENQSNDDPSTPASPPPTPQVAAVAPGSAPRDDAGSDQPRTFADRLRPKGSAPAGAKATPPPAGSTAGQRGKSVPTPPPAASSGQPTPRQSPPPEESPNNNDPKPAAKPSGNAWARGPPIAAGADKPKHQVVIAAAPATKAPAKAPAVVEATVAAPAAGAAAGRGFPQGVVNHYDLFCKGLPEGVTEDELIEALSPYVPVRHGTRSDLKLETKRVEDFGSPKIRTFAFVRIDAAPSDIPELIRKVESKPIKIRGQPIQCCASRDKPAYAKK